MYSGLQTSRFFLSPGEATVSLHLCQATSYRQQDLKQSTGNLPATEVLQALCPQQEPLTLLNCLNYYACRGKLA